MVNTRKSMEIQASISNELIIEILLGIVILLVLYIFLSSPSPRVVYKQTKPTSQLDYTYSDANLPSNVYLDLFSKSTPWIGDFVLGSGRTYVSGSL